MKDRAFWACLLAAAVVVAGCEVHEIPPPAVSVEEYRHPTRPNPHPYTVGTTILHNVTRALDRDLGEAERVESLRLVAHLGGGEQVADQVAGLLDDPATPLALRQEVLQMLLKLEHGGLAVHVARVLPTLDSQSALKEQVLEWLARHPAPDVLAQIVKLWAREESATGLNEPRYRQAVEGLTGSSWDQSLLNAINTQGFLARGSAMEVLAARIANDKLRQRVAALPAKTEAVAAMQVFLAKFAYLPTNGPSMLKCVWLYRTRPKMLEDVARLNDEWRRNYGYRFDVRDFHLLAGLARDPLRKGVRRTDLIIQLAHKFIKRSHVRRRIYRPGGLYDFSDRFNKHVETLTMADLWYLLLLDEMLNRPRVQAALRVMAQGDREDTRSAWGGLIFYENGRAEAKLYPPEYTEPGSDLVYSPTSEAIEASRDALCGFQGHFDRVGNADRAGPTIEELHSAKRHSTCGLVLTSVSAEEFCAHYYNPDGVVISLGKFPFR